MDELMAGYGPFQAVSTAKKMNSFLPGIWKMIAKMTLNVLPTSFDYMSLDFKIQRFEKSLGKPLWLWRFFMDEFSFNQSIEPTTWDKLSRG